MSEGDRLFHSWRAGRRLPMAFLDDYAQMSRAALALFQQTGEPGYLEQARAWVARCRRGLPRRRGRRLSSSAPPRRTGRSCGRRTPMTGRRPSANGTLAEVAAMLWHLTGEERYRAHGRRDPGRLRRRRPRQPGQPRHAPAGHAAADRSRPRSWSWATRRRPGSPSCWPRPPLRRRAGAHPPAHGVRRRPAGRPSGRRKAASRRPRRRLCLPRHHLRGPARRARGPARTIVTARRGRCEGDDDGTPDFGQAAWRPGGSRVRGLRRAGARPRRGAGPARRHRPELHRRLPPHRPVSRRRCR